jgi:hypothetical protein
LVQRGMKASQRGRTGQNFPERGQDAVEFAIIAPILLLIIVFIVDLGRVTYFAAVLHNAAREGARYGSIRPDDIAGIEDAVANLAIGIAPADLGIEIADDPDAKIIEVTVSYDLPILTPVVSAFLGGADTLLLDSSSTLGYEQ